MQPVNVAAITVTVSGDRAGVYATRGRLLARHGKNHAEGLIIPERKLFRPRALPVP
jgi:hypothetical protein